MTTPIAISPDVASTLTALACVSPERLRSLASTLQQAQPSLHSVQEDAMPAALIIMLLERLAASGAQALSILTDTSLSEEHYEAMERSTGRLLSNLLELVKKSDQPELIAKALRNHRLCVKEGIAWSPM